MKNSFLPSAYTAVRVLVLLAIALLDCAASNVAAADFDKALKSLTFYASFDKGADADFAKGDPRLFTRTATKPTWTSKPGLLTDDLTKLEPDKGLSGGTLRFTKRNSKWIFYKADTNLPYSKKNWSGSVSAWLRLDPEKDLDPGYCDPIQITTRKWNDGSFFVDFDKEGDPRDFRLGAFADFAAWNPENKKVNDISEDDRPLVKVKNPPFGSEKWTHVCFTWKRFNTGTKDGVASFYLDGKHVGDLEGWNQTWTWKDDEESRILIGLNYIGLFDDLMCFDRALSAKEVQSIYALRNNGKQRADLNSLVKAHR
jgi:hypothetical protein